MLVIRVKTFQPLTDFFSVSFWQLISAMRNNMKELREEREDMKEKSGQSAVKTQRIKDRRKERRGSIE